MVWLPELTNVTDIQTPHDGIGRAYASHHVAKIKYCTVGNCGFKYQKFDVNSANYLNFLITFRMVVVILFSII